MYFCFHIHVLESFKFLESFRIILSLFSHLLEENKLVQCNKSLAFSIKSINLIQKYPHIIESFACILEIFVVIRLLPTNFLFLLEYFQLQTYQSILHYHHLHKKLSDEFLLIFNPQDLLSFILGKLIVE